MNHKLVITGKEPTPIEICKANKRDLLDFRTTHDEVDVIIIQQVVKIANMGAKSIRVICDDTDVFVLLITSSKHLDCLVHLLWRALDLTGH